MFKKKFFLAIESILGFIYFFTSKINPTRVWFLGGQDLEMENISSELARAGEKFADEKLGWGAHASAYRFQIWWSLLLGREIRLVELDNQHHAANDWNPEKIPVRLPKKVVQDLVDHHGKLSDRPASILQTLKVLGVEPNDWHRAVAINDVDFLHGLLKNGFSLDMMKKIRAADAKAQGLTQQEIDAVMPACEAMQVVEINGIHMSVIDNLPHSRFAPVSNFAFFSGQIDIHIAICREPGSQEIQLEWYPALIQPLTDKFGGWSGAQYWGCSKCNPDEVLEFIQDWLRENGNPSGVIQPTPKGRF